MLLKKKKNNKIKGTIIIKEFLKNIFNIFIIIFLKRSRIIEKNQHKNINKFNNFVLLPLWIFILVISIKNILSGKLNNNIRNLNSISKIHLKIVNQNFNEREKILVAYYYLPDYIYLNGNITNNDNGYIYIDNNKTNNVTLIWNDPLETCEYLFDYLDYIIEIDLSEFDTSKVTSMNYMFYECINLKHVNLNNINTSLVVNMDSMFYGSISLTSIDLSNFDTSKVTSMKYMFSDCSEITSLNLNSFNTSQVSEMRYMFYGCKSLKNINLSNFDTSNVINMRALFGLCYSLTSINLSIFNVSKVEQMDYMFYKCNSLISLNLSNFKTSSLESMEYMFYDCYSLINIDLSNFDTSQVLNMESFFEDCTSLISVDLSNFLFLDCIMDYFFYNCISLTRIELPKIHYSMPISFYYVFYGCLSLTSLDISLFEIYFDDDSMECLFYECHSLTSLDLSNIHTFNVNTMEFTFYGCNSLIELGLSNFDTSKVTSISGMFYDCTSLKFLDLSNFNTNSLKNMQYLFYNCISLTSINVENFNTSLVEEMSAMFYGCSSLKSLNLTNFDTSNVVGMKSMFFGCIELISLDLSNFNTQNVIDMSFMLAGCKNLRYINFYNFNDIQLDNNKAMFFGTSGNLIIYINNQSYTENIISELTSLQCITYNLSINSEINKPKIIYNKRICIDNCLDNNIYKYEYENFCYKDCPRGTHFLNNSINLCEKNQFECKEEYPFLNVIDKSCSENCNSEDFFNEKCKLIYNEIKNKRTLISNIIDEIENGSMNELLLRVINKDKNEDLVIINNKDLYQITTSFNQNNKDYKNISSIKLGELENIIKEQYSIPKDESLIIFKIEQYIDGLLIPIIEYEIFNPETKEKIDLNLFNNTSINIEIYIPVLINESELYKYDLNSSYYNNICNIINRGDNYDLTLYERKNEYNNNNLSLCQFNCIYIKYDYNKKMVICQCKIQGIISLLSKINNINLINYAINKKYLTNLNIMKCYKIVFSKEGLIKNFGNYLITSIIFIYIILAIAFYLKGYNFLCIQINEILDKKNLEKENESNFKNKSKIEKQLKEDMSSNSKITNNKSFNFKNSFEINLDLNISQNNSSNIKKLDRLKKKNIKYMDYELNNISYNQALKVDDRTFLQYYLSLLKEKHIIFFTFIPKKDYNSFIIKLCLFIFIIPLNIVVNALFFNDTMMHKIYEDKGNYNFIYIIPRIIYSVLIISNVNIILQTIFLSQKNIIEIKLEKNRYNIKAKVMTVIKCLIIKYICFFIINFLFFLLFWYYMSSFCIIYKNTQLYLIKNSLISFLIYLICPFIIYLLPSFIRINSLKKPGKYYYITSQIISSL